MAKQLSPVSSFLSGPRSSPTSPNYFAPASPNHFVPTSPSHLEPKDGLTVLGYASAVRNRVLIAMDATKDPSEVCLVWALNNLVRPGDSVTILGILHRINNPMGYKTQANLSDFVGTNKTALEAEMSEKLVCFESKFRTLADSCDSRGVYLDITITAGIPLKSVLVKAATKIKVTHVLLDRHLRRERKYFKEHLQCEVIAVSDKNQAECVRESSISYMFDNPGLPLPRVNSAASSTVPSSPTSVATSFTVDGSGFRNSDASIYKGDARASLQSLMGRREDTSLTCLPEVKLNDKIMSEDLGDYSPGSEEQSMASSGSHSRENSFIDLFMLSSPDGILPVWSSVNGNEIGASPGRANAAEQAGFKAELTSSTTKLMSSPVADAGGEKPSTESALSTSYSSDQRPSECSQKDIISVQPRRHFSQLSELIKAHESQPDSDVTEGRPEDSFVPTSSKGEEVQLPQISVSGVVVDGAEEKHVSDMLTSQPEGTECVLRKHFTQAPPLCSVCKLTSMELGRSPRVYDWLELKAATNDFATENLIAEGGFSFVYKGILPEGQTVAIKKLKAFSVQGDDQFDIEVEALSCAQHRNLVRLLGYGLGINERALVYEYVCNGSLDQHLSGHSGAFLDWASRYKIAIGAARGLRYLHEECRVGCIVHRDLRPNNILITHDFVPMVGDFGLAKLNTNVDAAIETQVVGALGFLAPEYVECGQVTSKTDVYSFGVVLLELISGRKAFDLHRPKGEISLIEWARQKLQYHRIHELVDQRVAESLDMFELDRMVKAASLCIKRDPQARPGISQVLRILEGDSYELSIENMQELFPPHSSTKAGYRSHSLDDFHQSADILRSTSKKVTTAPKSWRNWVRT